MTRFQIYLDPQLIETLNYLSAQKHVSRSHVIRDLLQKSTKIHQNKLVQIKKGQKIDKKYNPLLKMSGFAKDLPRDLSQRVDEIYHLD